MPVVSAFRKVGSRVVVNSRPAGLHRESLSIKRRVLGRLPSE